MLSFLSCIINPVQPIFIYLYNSALSALPKNQHRFNRKGPSYNFFFLKITNYLQYLFEMVAVKKKKKKVLILFTQIMNTGQIFS